MSTQIDHNYPIFYVLAVSRWQSNDGYYQATIVERIQPAINQMKRRRS